MKKRKTSIIVHGLDEPAGVTTENRIENDKVVVEQLLHVISADEVSVNHMIRLGKRPEEVSAKPRPVKLVLASEDQKQKVLAKAKKLEGQAGGRLAQSIYTSRSDSMPERNAKEGSWRNETQAVARRNKYDCDKRASGGKEAKTLQCREHRRGQSPHSLGARKLKARHEYRKAQ